MIQQSILNPLLYCRLTRIFAEVKVHNRGEARIASVQYDGLDEPKATVRQWGETYAVCCPFCDERRFQLSISYLYGQRDEASGRPLTCVAHCFNARCMSSRDNRETLADMLSANDDSLAEALIRPANATADYERPIELPTMRTHLDRLPKGHPARRYLHHRGFDADRVGQYYDVSFCEDDEDRLARNRIIVPISFRGVHRGWQSLSIQESDQDQQRFSRYLSARGMHNSRLLYNRDHASQYETGIIVRHPHDVWAFGRMALCPVGDGVSEYQQNSILTAFRKRTAVLVMGADELAPLTIGRFVGVMNRSMPGRFVVVEHPRDLPLGAEGENACARMLPTRPGTKEWRLVTRNTNERLLSGPILQQEIHDRSVLKIRNEVTVGLVDGMSGGVILAHVPHPSRPLTHFLTDSSLSSGRPRLPPREQ